jgi:hypothetical protein
MNISFFVFKFQQRQDIFSSPNCPNGLQGPPILIFNRYQGLFPRGVKHPGHDANQSPRSHAEVKNECNYSPLPLYAFMEHAGTLPFSRLLWINSRPSKFNKRTPFSVTELFIYSFHLFVLMLITFAPAGVVENCSECILPITGTAHYRKLRYLMCLVTTATALAEFQIHTLKYKNLRQCKKKWGGGRGTMTKL